MLLGTSCVQRRPEGPQQISPGQSEAVPAAERPPWDWGIEIASVLKGRNNQHFHLFRPFRATHTLKRKPRAAATLV
jgi:hypothetical protein